MAGPRDEMDWMTFDWSDDLNDFAGSLTDGVDQMILGRKLAEGFIPHWESEPANESPEAIELMNSTPKAIISTTLEQPPRENTEIFDDPATAVEQLRQRDGGDLVTYGGVELMTSLVERDLLDQLHVFVNPVAIGGGRKLFPDLDSAKRYEISDARRFDCGVVVLSMRPESG